MFFFKQKTAYEMRISDWSSDVCSSDLVLPDVVDLLHREVGIRLGMRQIGMGDPVERDARHAQALPAACRVPPSGAATRRSAASNMRKPAGSRKTVTRTPGSTRGTPLARATPRRRSCPRCHQHTEPVTPGAAPTPP